MIHINLLPEELRKKAPRFKAMDLSSVDLSKMNTKELPLLNIAMITVGAFILFHLVLFVGGGMSRARYNSLSKEYDRHLTKKKEAEVLKAQSESITSKVAAINGLMVKRFSWAKKLNELSDSMTPGVWLNQLSYENKLIERIIPSKAANGAKNKKPAPAASTEKVVENYIILSGYTSQVGEGGTALVGKFIKSLRDNAPFYNDFNKIELVSIKSDKAENQEVMSFKITCIFKTTGN